MKNVILYDPQQSGPISLRLNGVLPPCGEIPQGQPVDLPEAYIQMAREGGTLIVSEVPAATIHGWPVTPEPPAEEGIPFILTRRDPAPPIEPPPEPQPEPDSAEDAPAVPEGTEPQPEPVGEPEAAPAPPPEKPEAHKKHGHKHHK